MSESSTLPTQKIKDEFPDELPAKKLCNQSPPFNPIQGDGPLGNKYSGKMFYGGSDKEQLVKTVQMMLNELGVSDDEGNSLEVDGDFGNKTEQALKKFQKKNKDWELKDLKADGLVGPRTSDALNRTMVGRWYKVYETDKELTEGQTFITVMSERFTEGLTVTLSGQEEAEEGSSPSSSSSGSTPAQVIRRRRNDGRAAFENVPEALKPVSAGQFKVEILDENLNKFDKSILFEIEKKESKTDNDGILKLRKKRSEVSLVGIEGQDSSSSQPEPS
jgi:peptidoglycan hydrolase-like protein with peptidoglycan-binding domain